MSSNFVYRIRSSEGRGMVAGPSDAANAAFRLLSPAAPPDYQNWNFLEMKAVFQLGAASVWRLPRVVGPLGQFCSIRRLPLDLLVLMFY